MKILLHMGTEKTGTTSFQTWAAQNRAALLRQGVFYSRVLGETNHLRLYLAALPEGQADDGFDMLGLRSDQARAALRRDAPEQLAAELSQARAQNCHTFLISNELCHSRLITDASVVQVRRMLSAQGDPVEILCWLRPQVDLAVSFASTLARGRVKVGAAFFETLGPDHPYFNYHALHQRWARAFGETALRFVAFPDHPDVTVYICDQLGLKTEGFAPARRMNEALDVQSIALLNLLAEGRPPGDVEHPLTALPLQRLPCEDRLQIGLDLAQRIHARFAPSNAALAAARSDVTAQALTPDWSRYDAPANLHLLDADNPLARQLRHVVIAFNRQTKQTAALQKLAEAERALARKNVDGAAVFLKAARAQYDLSRAGDRAPEPPGLAARIARLEARPEIAKRLDPPGQRPHAPKKTARP